MLALKNINGVMPVLGNTSISKSAIWNSPVDQINPAQLIAFRARLALENNVAEADATIAYLLLRIKEVAPDAQVLRYAQPRKVAFMSSDICRGFVRMTPPAPAAIIFGIETNLTADQVTTLTWLKAKAMIRSNKLSDQAILSLKSQPIHITSRYVFWRYVERKALPLFGLEQEVFDAFGMVWAELTVAYRGAVMIDYDAEMKRWQELLLLTGKA